MNLPLRLLSIGVVGVFIVGGGWLYSTIIHTDAISATPERMSRHLQVQVTGAVVHPGLFVLNDDSRVFHAIAAAGGFALGADTRINLAAHLYDGQRLEIPYLIRLNPLSYPGVHLPL